MQLTGFVRKLDVLGRITIPAELRKKLNIDTKDAVEIFLDRNNKIVLKKYEPCDMFTGGDMNELIDFQGKKVSKKNIVKMAEIAGLTLVDET